MPYFNILKKSIEGHDLFYKLMNKYVATFTHNICHFAGISTHFNKNEHSLYV